MISGGSRPSDKGGPGHPVPEIRGRRVFFFGPSGLSWGPSSGSATDDTFEQYCTPLWIHHSMRSKHGGKWCDKRREKHCQFSFLWTNTTTQRWSLKQKETIFKVIPEEKQRLVEENDADNIRKVLRKSSIHWFWELNLYSYKNRVNCFDSLWLFFCCCWSESLEILYNKTLDVRSLRKPVSFVFPRVLTVSFGIWH